MSWSLLSVLQWSALAAVLVWVIHKLGTWTYGEFVTRGMVFPAPTFFIGNSGPFVFGTKSLGELSRDIYRTFKGHRVIGFFNFNKPTLMIRDPEIIKLVTVKDFDHFTDHDALIEEDDDLFFGKFLFSLKGARWKAMRTILSPAFTASKMKSMFVLIAKCGEQLGEYLEDQCKENTDEVLQIELQHLAQRYANDVIATSAFGIHCDSLRQPDNEFFAMGREATDFGGIKVVKFFMYALAPWIMKLLRVPLTSKRVEKFFCSIVSDTMQLREREHIVRPDMIQLMMEARKGTLKADPADGVAEEANKTKLTHEELSDDNITAQAFLFFLAGFETSSSLMSFLGYQLALHPDVQERVRQEVDEVLAEEDGHISYDGVQRMKYLECVVSETLRMWPPVAELDRICIKDYVVPATDTQPEVVFKKGDAVVLPAHGMHRDPEYFPEPDRFDPERFSDENKHNIKPFTYYPFGVGPRVCIGLRFAIMEGKIAIANILRRFELVVTAKTPIPIQLKKHTFNTSAEGGFWLGIKPRSS